MSLEFWKRLPIRRQLMLAVNGMLLLVVVALFLIVGHGLRIRDAKQEERKSRSSKRRRPSTSRSMQLPIEAMNLFNS